MPRECLLNGEEKPVGATVFLPNALQPSSGSDEGVKRTDAALGFWRLAQCFPKGIVMPRVQRQNPKIGQELAKNWPSTFFVLFLGTAARIGTTWFYGT